MQVQLQVKVPRSGLKNRNYLNFSLFFEDFCLKVFGIKQSNRTKVAFNDYVDKILPFFDHHLPPRGHFSP